VLVRRGSTLHSPYNHTQSMKAAAVGQPSLPDKLSQSYANAIQKHSEDGELIP
jgi:hypothetical protein